jgi:drug/metabolite transporter (DMT)-like permease
MIEPVMAAICAMLFTGETMTARKAAGGAIILLGNLACELMGRPAPEEKTA